MSATAAVLLSRLYNGLLLATEAIKCLCKCGSMDSPVDCMTVIN